MSSVSRPIGHRHHHHHHRHEMHHYVRGGHHKPVASWGCPVAPDQSDLRHPDDVGGAFSDGYREKRQGGLRQMPLREYAAQEFHHEFEQVEKCSECNQDVDPLDSSGANQDIDDYLNYVLANGYLRPDLCKNIGIRELLSPHKCKTTPSGSTKYHCGHCCKGQTKNASPHEGTAETKKKSSDDTLNCGIFDKSKKACGHGAAGYITPVALNCGIICAHHTRDTRESGKSKSLSELAHAQKKAQKVEKETQSSPSTENTLMQTKASPSKASIQCCADGDDKVKIDRLKRPSLEDITQSKSSTNVGLTRETCPCACSHGENFVRFTLSSSEADSNCKETGL